MNQLDRRQVIAGTAALAAFAVAGGTVQAADSHHKHHSKKKYGALIQSSLHCIDRGRICADHCIDLLKDGDKDMGACLESVTEMMAAVDALNHLAISESKYVKEMAGLCQKICLDCAKECKKHAKKHEQCKDCLDACNDCAKACERYS